MGFLVEYYDLIPGTTVAAVYREPDGTMTYKVIEPALDAEDEKMLKLLKVRIHDYAGSLDELIRREVKSEEDAFSLARELIEAVSREYEMRIPRDKLDKYVYYIKRDLIGYGPIDPLFRDPFIEDVHLDGPGIPVYVWHVKYESLRTNIVLTWDEAYRLISKFATRIGRQVSSADPILEGVLPEGARVEALLPDVTGRGPAFTIRKYYYEPLTIVNLVKDKTITAEAAAYLWLLLDYGRNLIIVGPTGAGKTTLLNSLLYLIRPEAKIITIEDTRELNIVHEHWLPMVTRPSRDPTVKDVSMFDLLTIAMRSRPDYVVVGEVRGREAYVLFQAFGSGHYGATTIHADNSEQALKRLLSRPMRVPPMLISLAHAFVVIHKVKVGDRIVRRVVAVDEFLGLIDGSPRFNRLFEWNPREDRLVLSSESEHLKSISRDRFVDLEELRGQLKLREEVIEGMVAQGWSRPELVARVIRAFHRDPLGTIRKVKMGVLP